MSKTILATGGAGFVGSHVAAALAARGDRVVLLDDFSNAPPDIAIRLAESGAPYVEIVRADIRDAAALDRLFASARFDAVIHLAGLKSIGESVAQPVAYYDVNVAGALVLLAAMARAAIPHLVFSSTAAIYGPPRSNPVPEDASLAPATPYGRSKAMVETILADAAAADPRLGIVSLRYFNPVGAHPSARLGESPRVEPSNLFPILARAAAGLRDRVLVHGRDYPTRDGTGIRDFIHVQDLAAGHLAALDFLAAGGGAGRHHPVNLGAGAGTSVLEAIAAFERASGRPIPTTFAPRRPGDVAECVADPRRAATLLGWHARHDLATMCADHWAFQQRELAETTGN